MSVPASREIDIPGVKNFRDLGGLVGCGGRIVRRGLVFRSAKFDKILPEGEAVLDALGIRTIVDFRSPGEQRRNPTNYARPQVRRLSLTVFSDTPEGFFEERLTRGLSPQGALALMEEANRSFARERYAAFRDFFALFHNPENFPLVFHCTGGKDRTGFAAAMLYSVLGVNDSDIREDFLLSRKNTIPTNERSVHRLLEIIPPKTLEVLMTVFPQFLEAALDEIEKAWGSRERFLREALGVSPELSEKIRTFLLA
ncbi:MAG: tyrosine-protein phosphatase [Opitutales bacterium]|nr:tyrosine-protein phosphatase [Opitutales bacterium]